MLTDARILESLILGGSKFTSDERDDSSLLDKFLTDRDTKIPRCTWTVNPTGCLSFFFPNRYSLNSRMNFSIDLNDVTRLSATCALEAKHTQKKKRSVTNIYLKIFRRHKYSSNTHTRRTQNPNATAMKKTAKLCEKNIIRISNTLSILKSVSFTHSPIGFK